MSRNILRQSGEEDTVLNKRKFGLKIQCVIALLISATIALTVFGIFQYTINYFFESYFENSRYANKIAVDYMDSFEEYVSQNNISANDIKSIDKWVKSKRSVSVILYITRNGKSLYDSLQSDINSYAFPFDDNSENEPLKNPQTDEMQVYAGEDYSSNEWFYQRKIAFTDGAAIVSFYVYFANWIYNSVFLLSVIISFVVLCISFLYFIRKKINRILKLERDIKILETGELNYPVSISGSDEIASLANSLDQMRLTLLQNIKEEADIVQNNYDLVVSVSHDIRTPLTSLALYLDLIYAEKYENTEQFNNYLQKSRNKVTQIKQMTDNLFEKFYLEKEPEFEPPEFVQTIFCDVISATLSYLYENGFNVNEEIVWSKKRVVVSNYYITRIFDNINSNIIKYADSGNPIDFKLAENKNNVKIIISNYTKQLDKQPESTGVGIKNIGFMMEKMNGSIEVDKQKDRFTITMTFPEYK